MSEVPLYDEANSLDVLGDTRPFSVRLARTSGRNVTNFQHKLKERFQFGFKVTGIAARWQPHGVNPPENSI